jgi:SAM-dependent methyltransferase
MLEFYVPRFAHCQRVLDVGCGEGQFIETLVAHGIHASGVDADTQMMRVCQAKGLDVVEADLFDYLPQHTDEFDGILVSNVIEHFVMQDTLRLLGAAFHALRPGGILLLATPNPESLIVHLYEFWRDATHTRLYNRSLLEFLLSWAGFHDIQSGENPMTAWSLPPELQNVPKLLEDLPHWRDIPPLGGEAQPIPEERKLPLPQRMAHSLRQRLVQFLLHTAFSKEYGALTNYLASLSGELHNFESQLAAGRATAQQVGSALYQSQSLFLAAPREIFALGVKPAAVPEEGR